MLDLSDLQVFLTVSEERSFSRAAARLYRTQPAVSQAVRRIEEALGERLIDRSSRDGTLTEAGRQLQEYARRLLRLSEEAEASVRDLRDLRRGRVLIGANEAAIAAIVPVLTAFKAAHPQVLVDVRRVAARQIPVEVAQGSLDCGVLTFRPGDQNLDVLPLGDDEMVMLVSPSHPLASRDTMTMAEVGRQVVIAHNDPSPIREQVLQWFAEHQAPLNIQMALPSLDGIKRVVEMGVGVALLPRRCALTELALGRLVAVRVPQLTIRRSLQLVYRQTGYNSHAMTAFLEVARQLAAPLQRRYGKRAATSRTRS